MQHDKVTEFMKEHYQRHGEDCIINIFISFKYGTMSVRCHQCFEVLDLEFGENNERARVPTLSG
jgi:hypothetical protein